MPVKTGMRRIARRWPLVADACGATTRACGARSGHGGHSGDRLMADETVQVLVRELFLLATGDPQLTKRRCCWAAPSRASRHWMMPPVPLLALGAPAVLLKGGICRVMRW